MQAASTLTLCTLCRLLVLQWICSPPTLVSADCTELEVINAYQSVLCRDADVGGLNGWLNHCQAQKNVGKTITQGMVEAALKGSAEYKECDWLDANGKCTNSCALLRCTKDHIKQT